MGKADTRIARYLLAEGAALQLSHDLVDLTEARCADRLAIRDAAAIGIHRKSAACTVVASGITGALLARGAQARLRQVDDLGTALGVLQLGNVDILGAHAGGGECCRRSIDRRTRANPR